METFQTWRTSSISKLTNNYHGSNKYEQVWELAGIPKVGPRSTPVFWLVFTEDRRLLMFHSIPYRKKLFGKYTLSIL